MIYAVLIVFGLCLGSFVNALVWRLYEQSEKGAKSLSIARGRSMCPHCRHELAPLDLIPVFSWLTLRGKCRYCGKPISVQYPLVELTTAALFVVSYVWWPQTLNGQQVTGNDLVFGLWLVLLVGLMALFVYDMRWFLLPNRILYPLAGIAVVYAVLNALSVAPADLSAALGKTVLAVLIGGGVFYVLFQVSKGKWIGGGDVKLGWLLGLLVGTPGGAVLFIFLGSLLGSLISVPLLANGRLKRTSVIPFGPFLIIGAVITVLFGGSIIDWYRHLFFAA